MKVTRTRISAVLLSAGESTRMGYPKALLDWQGVPLVQYQVRSLIDSGVDQVIAVLGHKAESIRPLVESEPGAEVVVNLRYRTGKSSSVRAGLKMVNPEAEHVTIISVDQPRSPKLLSHVLEAHLRHGSTITYPVYQGRGGHPVLFSRALLPELMGISEARKGLREVIERHGAEVNRVQVDDPEAILDMNTVEDYRRAAARTA